jgi:hypothetical protein
LPQPRKNKDLALRTLRKNFDELFDEDSPDEEELTFIARRFYRNEHRISKRFGKPKESTQDRNKKDPHGPKCYEYSGYSYVCKDCGNLKSNKPNEEKAYNITLSDIDEEVLDDSPNYVAFVASYEFDNFKQLDVQFDNESNRVSGLQNVFDNLMENFLCLEIPT